ncbi:transposase [bacterium]|nr:transposase [bacterium]
MFKKTALMTLFVVFIFQIISLFFVPSAEAADGPVEWIDKYKFWIGIGFLFLTAAIAQILDFLLKDRLVKPFVGKYVNVKLKQPFQGLQTYRGILRIQMKGIEIISEKARMEGKGGSYYLEGINANNDIAAYIRYHDEMTESELEEREKEKDKAYHPGPLAMLYRKMRNAYGFMKSAFDAVFKQLYSRYVQSRIYKQQFVKEAERLEQTTGAELETKAEGLKEVEQKLKSAYLGDFDYDPILERMVGTRVQLAKGVKEVADPKHVIFVDYTKNFCYFMDVKYIDEFSVTVENDDDSQPAEDRELRVTRQGDGIFVESNLPYPIQLTRVEFKDKDNKVEQKMEELEKRFSILEKYGQMFMPFDRFSQTTGLGPFGGVTVNKHKNLNWRSFKKQTVYFTEERMADVVFHRTVAAPTSRVEKYEPLRMKLGAMTESFLEGEEEAEDEVLIVDENNDPIPGIHIYHGYITNVDQDRVDPREIDIYYSRRWQIEHDLATLEKKLRPIKPPRLIFPNVKKKRMLSQATLVEKLNEDKLAKNSISQVLYSPVMRNGYHRPKPKVNLPIKVLAFMGNMTRVEFPVLRRFERIHGHKVLYEQTQDSNLPRIEKANIVWIGQGEIFREGYRLKMGTESKIKNFVSRGGIVITSGQYLTALPRRAGWIPERLVGVDKPETKEFDPTMFAGDLFQTPNQIEPGNVIISDSWTEWTNNFTVLATANGGDDAAVLLFRHGEGIYLVTAFRNQSESDIQTNAKMMENLLHYSIEWLEEQERPELSVA